MALLTLEKAWSHEAQDDEKVTDKMVTINTDHITSIHPCYDEETNARSFVCTSDGEIVYLVNTREEVVQACDIMEGGAFEDDEEDDEE